MNTRSVLYLAFINIKPSMMGVIKKIKSQARAMSHVFQDFRCLVIGDHSPILLASLENETEPFMSYIPIQNMQSKGFTRMVEARIKGVRLADKLLQKQAPTFLYLRYPLGCPWMLWFFKKVNARGAKIITEHQSFEYHELVNQKRYHLAFCEKLFGKKCLHNVYGAVGVTKEIAEYEKSRSSKFKIAVVPNGIDVSSYPIKKRSTYDSKNGLDVLFVGAVSDWHGIDRFIKGMSISQAKTLRLHIVGDGSGVTNLKQIVMKDKLDEKVIFHDFKIGKELDDMFDKCQIAIGSLGLHRLDLSESSVLKVREYCARGIPFIYSPIDEDFPEYFHYRMKVSPDDSPIDIRKVIDFSKRVLSERQCSERMRDYAEKKLEWDVKIKKLSIFLDEIVQAEDKP